ncbi:MAG: signal recognition particle-docking protein FtsY [Cyanobacteria bacterium P01_D01_bin.105]
MTGFNWFDRSYDEPDKANENENTEETPPEAAAPASPEDYLKWAKAAYQNIQERQEGETAADEAASSEASVEAEPSQTDPSETVTVEKITAESETADTTEDAIASEDTTETEAVDASVEEDTADSRKDSPVQAFWAKAEQAQAEREERLERLEAEAILEPEPEPDPSAESASEANFVPLDIDLDEAFLWSAEVLASQGRRPDQISIEEITWLNKLRQGLDKTRRGLVNQLKSIVGQGPLNDEAVDEIESLLLQADVGVAATDKIIGALQARLKEETLPPEQAINYLKKLLRDMLDAPLEGGHNLTFTPEKDRLSIWLMTGVNGAGKTTTIGKLTHIAKKSGFKCLIGAADTFRAAAVEQVKVWGQRSGVEVIANPGQNTDPASVVFDAISAANSRGTELLLIDTAGRLQNKKNLMDELSKVRKIIDKKAPDANVESLLVLDSTLGQNGLRQAQVFAETAQLSGVVLTKLDGTARGGVALAVVQQLGLPIRFIGAGEGIEDLRPFSSYEFVEALLNG